ncbi:type II toxin-antitoxin system RelE/ParE family toxin [bacterium]|nr:MAG: type II toxin-antitoxin system RelE/ParE family toxin [bacterium]
MEGGGVELLLYRTASGDCPVRAWLESLDAQVEALVAKRFDRVRRGLFGDTKLLGGGVWELKIDVGPGYRIYYGLDGPRVVVLLCAGQKDAQERDIARARAYWESHLRQKGL